MMLTLEEVRNLLYFLAKTPITGAEALTLAILQQKLGAMLNVTTTTALDAPPPQENPNAPKT